MNTIARHQRTSRTRLIGALLFSTALFAIAVARAANPASGTIAATSTSTVSWVGDAPGVPPAVGVVQESTCVDGANCDVYTLNVSGTPADWAGKQIVIGISWQLPTSDYDFYIHKDTVSGTLVSKGVNDGPPATSDKAVINPATTGTGKYIVHVLYATTVPSDQYNGSVKVQAASGPSSGAGPATRTATYITGAATGITFSNNVPLKAPVTTRDGEPSNRTDYLGNSYVGAIRGFPAGVDLWRINLNPAATGYDPFMRVPIYQGQPDAFSPASEADLGGDGGGDIDLAVAFPPATGPTPSATPTLAFSSLIAANISTGNSTDGGQTFSKNPIGNCTGGLCVDDRQWEEFLGQTTVYMLYRTLDPAVTQIQRSNDSGLTFGPASTAGAIGQVGQIDVHQSDGVVYVSGSSGQVGVGVPSVAGQAPLTTDYKVVQAASDPNGVAHLFFLVKVADDGTKNGTAYICYSNENDVYIAHSTDQGKTWAKPVKVNGGIPTAVNIFPWIETGPLPGSVGIVWYGTTASSNSDAAEWKVYFAQSFNATADTPTFSIAEVTEAEHYIHGSNISEGGLTGAANRNLIDYFQISFDPNGAAVVAYTDDHNDYDGHTYAAHQLTGASIKTGAALPSAVEGSAMRLPPGDKFPPRVPGYNGEQVTDYAQDAQESSAARVRADDPEDVLSVRYDTSGTGSSLAIAATMRVSDLSLIPGQTTWQMSFAVNAPHNVLAPTGTYSFGLSDHADQFYIQADTDVSGAMTYTYGTVKRASDGKLIYTQVGNADAGAFNQDDNTISVQVSVAKLNAVLAAAKHPLIGDGTVISGLRGRAYTIEVVPPVNGQGSRQGRRDICRGGTQFVVHDSSQPYPSATPLPTPLPVQAVAAGASPSPTPPRSQLGNISTRLSVQPGDQAGIAGIIVRGSAPKRALFRGIGPTLGSANIAAPIIDDPTLEIHDASGAKIAGNDNWRGDPGTQSQQAEITASGLAPMNDKESAVVVNLSGNQTYTAILRSKTNQVGIGLIEVYDLDAGSLSDFGNLSTRGSVGVGDAVLIGGFIVNPSDSGAPSQKVVVRALGPSIKFNGQPLAGTVRDTIIELHDINGVTLETNDDFSTSPEAAEITAAKLNPGDPHESAILRTLPPGAYTAVVRGKGDSTGIGIVEAYNLGAP